MNFTVDLPDDLGQRVKSEELKLARLLRDAVASEFWRRDAMSATPEETKTYEVDVESNGEPYVGRIRGRRIIDHGDVTVYLTDDGRVLQHNIDYGNVDRLDGPGNDLLENLQDLFAEGEIDEFPKVCTTLGLRPVMDL